MFVALGAALGLLGLLAAPEPASAQRPGEVEGRVVDEAGEPVGGASVHVRETGRAVSTDAAGRFRILAVEPGTHLLRVRSLGFAPLEREVEVEAGRTRRIVLRLATLPVRLEGLEITAVRPSDPSVIRIGPDEVRRSGAATLGDLLRGRPGVTVVGRGAGGPQVPRIRGSAPDAVLVLVDGVPLNDPLTGEADLSQLPASSVRSVRILPGARGAAHGPRARAGVVLVETGGTGEGAEATLGAGSLGLVSAGLDARGAAAGGRWGVGGSVRESDGEFRFARAAEVGGGEAVRRNADVSLASLRGRWDHAAAGVGVRLSAERLERGLPGRSFAPSVHARQEVRGVRGALTLERGRDSGSLRASLWASGREARHLDPAPPTGLPYDDRARVRDGGLRVEGELAPAGEPAPASEPAPAVRGLRLGGGVELRGQDVDAGDLLDAAPSTRVWGGVHARADLRFPDAPTEPTLSVALRADRVPDGGWTPSHEARLSGRAGPLRFHLAHRSAFSPPTLADQHFRQGVGVVPNPDLRGERVRSETEAGLALAREAAGGRVRLGLTAHHGRVHDLVLWLPDFRFVWSPRNVDAERYGAEARLEWSRSDGPGRRVSVEASHAWSRVHRLDAPRLRGVQLPYRPEHASSLRLALERPAARFSLEARYTGERWPRAAEVNALPGFWEIDVSLARTFRHRRWELEPVLRVERLLDRSDALVFGFPEPGRTVSVGLTVRRTGPRRP